MTNSEYFEKNGISFAEAMKLFNEQTRFKSFDKFLAAEHAENKFKVGDLIVLQLNEETRKYDWKHNVVFEVLYYKPENGYYHVKQLTPSKSHKIGYVREMNCDFIDRNCILY